MIELYYMDWIPISGLPVDASIINNVKEYNLSGNDIVEKIDGANMNISNVFMRLILERKNIKLWMRADGLYIFSIKFSEKEAMSISDIAKKRLSSYISGYIKEYFGHSHHFHGYYMDKYINLSPIMVAINDDNDAKNKVEGCNILDVEPLNDSDKRYYKRAVLGIRWSFLRIGNSTFRGLNKISNSIIMSGLWWLFPYIVLVYMIFSGNIESYKILNDYGEHFNSAVFSFIVLLIGAFLYVAFIKYRSFNRTIMAAYAIMVDFVGKVGGALNDVGWAFSKVFNRYIRTISGFLLVFLSYYIVVQVFKYMEMEPNNNNIYSREYVVWILMSGLVAGVVMELLSKRTRKIKLLYYGMAILEYAKIYDLVISRIIVECKKEKVLSCPDSEGYERIQSAMKKALKYEYHKMINAIMLIIIIVIGIYIYSRFGM